MKKNRILLTVFLLFFLVIAWFAAVSKSLKPDHYEEYYAKAKEYEEKNLLQKSMIEYEQALSLRETQSVRDEMLHVQLLSYQNGLSTETEYVNKLVQRCELYPETVQYWEILLQFLVEKENYSSAKKYLDKVDELSVSSEVIEDLRLKVMYSFTEDRTKYKKVFYSTNQEFTVFDGSYWGVLDATGEQRYECKYIYAGPTNSLGDVIVVSEKLGKRIINTDNIIQAWIDVDFDECHTSGNKMIPYCKDNIWKYVNFDKTIVLDAYENASSFYNQRAVVKKDGIWTLINIDGTKACDYQFSDVKLYDSGEYLFQNIMIASIDSKYGMYSGLGEKLNSFTAKDMDIYLGDYIAFMDDSGKWGYINQNGEIVIEAQYENAKSFSNGLAAVEIDGKWGFINHSNQLVIENMYACTSYFTKKHACMVGYTMDNYFVIQLRY